MNKKYIILLTAIAVTASFTIILIFFNLKYNTTNKNSDKYKSKVNSVYQEVYSSEVLGIEQKPSLRLMAVGDIMLGRTVAKRLNGDYTIPFSEVKPFLQQSDILFGNLESPISDKGTKVYGKGITLRADPKAITGIKDAGFDIISLANNHILDYHKPALTQTIEILNANKILHCGAGENINQAREPVIIDRNGLKVAFLAYTDMSEYFFSSEKYNFLAKSDREGVAPRKLDYIIEDINSVRDKTDLVVISLHWGVEESFDVTDKMIEFSHMLIDSGADVILGHHPHQLQAIEIYKNKPIAYSMGNFIFDQNDDENKESIILDLQFDDTDLISVEAIPLRIVDKMKVIPAPPEKLEIIQNRLINLSNKLGTKGYIKNKVVKFKLPQ